MVKLTIDDDPRSDRGGARLDQPILTTASVPTQAIQPSRLILAPLLPLALAMGLGVYLDRMMAINPIAYGVMIAAGMVLMVWPDRSHGVDGGAEKNVPISTKTWLRMGSSWVVVLSMTGVWHQLYRQPAADDVMHAASLEGHFVRLRGRVVSEVDRYQPDQLDLRSMGFGEGVAFTLQAEALDQATHWLPVSGQVRVGVGSTMSGVFAGDRLELIGTLRRTGQASNPGSEERERRWQDQRLFCLLHVKDAGGIIVLPESRSLSFQVVVAQLRSWIRDLIEYSFSAETRGWVQALLLGEQRAVPREQSDGYRQAGVYHVLAVSGMHLVVLAGFAGMILRIGPWNRKGRWLGLTLMVILYALISGGQPPIIRASILVLAFIGGKCLNRDVEPVNALALAWIVIGVYDPSDLARTGTHLSFLAVLLIFLVVPAANQFWDRPITDPLEKLIREAEPRLVKMGRMALRSVGMAYTASLIIWLGTWPLLMDRFHLFSPIAILLGPPVILLTSLGLMAAFVWLFLAVLNLPGIAACAAVADWFLQESAVFVSWANHAGVGIVYCADLPPYWLEWGYAGMLSLILITSLQGRALPWRLMLMLAAVWCGSCWWCMGPRTVPGQWRCTVLAVGHGQCAVVETAEGRVVLFDAGSITGPEVATNIIAPFLWSRGMTRVDEIVCSHADLDHFNAVPALLERFAVGQVSLNPSFMERLQAGGQGMIRLLERKGIPIRTLSVGEKLSSGSMMINVLHPPLKGPEGPENARSLVLSLTWGGKHILLTGDLQEPGLSMVLAKPIPPVDILLAPHHGSPLSNTPSLAAWAKARLVISSEGRLLRRQVDPYSPLGATFWRTHEEGAIVIVGQASGWQARAFRSGRAWSAPPSNERSIAK